MGQSVDHILRIGVTGGIGSGKSLVCTLFARLGVPVLSADTLAKELMVKDSALRTAILKLLGASAYKPDGSLDRQYVASKIFSNKTLQKKINAAVHPRVEKELDRQLDELDRQGAKMAIVEAALIYEAGYDKKLDIVIVVDADERERVRRIAERDHTAEDEVRKRMRSQWSAGRKVQKADYVIRNDGSIEQLETNVRFLHTLFTSLTV
ncbi:MAG: dephospho-CoA kinase [Bacteroidota bacterium]